jgi:CheY-like chemotaxis protein
MRYRWRDAWKSEGHRYWEHREWEERLAHPYRRRLHEFGVPELPQAHPARRVTSSPSTSTADMPSLGLPAERAAQGTVLLVSDDLNALVALETLISEAGHSVMTATNRKDALEKAQCRQPDVVVSHMMMPMIDGSTLVSALSAAPQVPVSAFLKKPYAPEQLLALIGA